VLPHKLVGIIVTEKREHDPVNLRKPESHSVNVHILHPFVSLGTSAELGANKIELYLRKPLSDIAESLLSPSCGVEMIVSREYEDAIMRHEMRSGYVRMCCKRTGAGSQKYHPLRWSGRALCVVRT
jgi:hypothetical protein